MPPRNSPDRVVRVLERQRIPLPPNLDTARIRERLIDAAVRAGMPDALEHRRRGLFAKGAVGVIDIGDIAIEIVPKTRDGAETEEGRSFLVDLLRFVGRDRGTFATAAASIRDGEGGLAEVLYAWALATTAQHVRSGIPRRYTPRTEVSTSVRGRIDMKRVALARPGRDFELVVRHAPLSVDSDVGRMLRWLVCEISLRTRRIETRRFGQALLADFEGIADVEASEQTFDKIALRPLEEHWEPVLSFARSLAHQRSLDPSAAGRRPAVAVLFTLHDLFERALRRVLHEKGPVAGLFPGRIPRDLLVPPDGRGLVRLRPDYVFRVAVPGREYLAVGDAKWKDIWTTTGAPEPFRDDVYQLAAYMVAGQVDAGFLFAPLVGGGQGEPLRVCQFKMAGSGTRVDVIGVHVPTLVSSSEAGERLRNDLCTAIKLAVDGAAERPVP